MLPRNSLTKAVRQAGLSIAMAVSSAAIVASNWGMHEKAGLLGAVWIIGGFFVFIAGSEETE